MGRVVNFYRTQIELMWRWRAGRVALIKRAMIALVAGVIAFNLTAWLFPPAGHPQLGGGLIAVVFISAINLIVRPAFLALVASRSVALLVVLTLLFQAVVIWLLEPFVPPSSFTGGFIAAFVISFVFGFFPTAITPALGSARTIRTTARWSGRSPAGVRCHPHRPSRAW